MADTMYQERNFLTNVSPFIINDDSAFFGGNIRAIILCQTLSGNKKVSPEKNLIINSISSAKINHLLETKFPADSVTFTEEILNRRLRFLSSAVCYYASKLLLYEFTCKKSLINRYFS